MNAPKIEFDLCGESPGFDSSKLDHFTSKLVDSS